MRTMLGRAAVSMALLAIPAAVRPAHGPPEPSRRTTATDTAPTAAVAGGQVRGSLLAQSGAVFKAIPYAQPPVGDLRWRQPVPVKSWTGVRDATALGAPCAQNSGSDRMLENSKEDCLFLNVWTSEWPPASRKPVMFWI